MKSFFQVSLLATLFFFVVLMNFGYQNEHSSYNEAITTAQKEKKPLLLLFTASWCGPCKQLKNDTLYPLMEKLREVSVVYFVDIDKQEEQKVIKAYKNLPPQWRFGGAVPCMYLTDSEGKKLVKKNVGYMSREDFIEWFNND